MIEPGAGEIPVQREPDFGANFDRFKTGFFHLDCARRGDRNSWRRAAIFRADFWRRFSSSSSGHFGVAPN